MSESSAAVKLNMSQTQRARTISKEMAAELSEDMEALKRDLSKKIYKLNALETERKDRNKSIRALRESLIETRAQIAFCQRKLGL